MRYWSLAYNDKYYGTFFKELGKKLGTFHTQWLKPQEIIDGLEGSLELPNLVERRRQKGYVLILDNEEIKEFLDLKEAQKHYDLPNPIG
jgi:hypothetical protein